MSLALALLLPTSPEDPEQLFASVCAAELGFQPTFQPRPVDQAFPGVQHFEFKLESDSFLAVSGSSPHPDAVEIADALDAPDRSAVAAHRGWLAVTSLSDGSIEFEDCYPPMARLLAGALEQTDAHPLRVLHSPQWCRSALVRDSTAAALRGPQPLTPFGIRYTRLGCLLQEGDAWVTMYPSPYGPIGVELIADADGPTSQDVDRVRTTLDDEIRLYRARVAFSLTHRPLRLRLEADGVIRMQFRNKFTGLRSRWVNEDQVHREDRP